MTLSEYVTAIKALSDPHRTRAVMALRDGELCVCQIIELLGLAPSTISKHMSILKLAGLVECRKEGRWVYYALADTGKESNTADSITFTLENLKNDQTIRNDALQLQKIKSMDLATLCRK